MSVRIPCLPRNRMIASYRCRFTSKAVPIIKIRRSHDHFIFVIDSPCTFIFRPVPGLIQARLTLLGIYIGISSQMIWFTLRDLPVSRNTRKTVRKTAKKTGQAKETNNDNALSIMNYCLCSFVITCYVFEWMASGKIVDKILRNGASNAVSDKKPIQGI